MITGGNNGTFSSMTFGTSGSLGGSSLNSNGIVTSYVVLGWNTINNSVGGNQPVSATFSPNPTNGVYFNCIAYSYTLVISTPTVSPTTGIAQLTSFAFTEIPTGGAIPYSYSWSFGDGNISTAQNPTHVYALPGIYMASVTVTDSNNISFSANAPSVIVTVLAPAGSPKTGSPFNASQNRISQAYGSDHLRTGRGTISKVGLPG